MVMTVCNAVAQLDMCASIPQIPSMAEISEQLAYISSVKQLEEAKNASDLYLNPPIKPYGM
jgi:hypothetical protein